MIKFDADLAIHDIFDTEFSFSTFEMFPPMSGLDNFCREHITGLDTLRVGVAFELKLLSRMTTAPQINLEFMHHARLRI